MLIIGDYTARVGDPSGRSSLRPMLSDEEIEANAATFQEQAMRILAEDPELLEVRRNSEWLSMPSIELLKLMRNATAAQLLEREDFAKRWEAQEPISMLELLYPLLQGYDSVAIDADVELGGTDQKFNLLFGRDIQRAYGRLQQAILTMPILVGVDGSRKMSKSLGNQIGVLDPPQEMYGKAMAIPDSAMGEYYRLLLHREPPPEAARQGRRRSGRRCCGAGAAWWLAHLRGRRAECRSAISRSARFVQRENPRCPGEFRCQGETVHRRAGSRRARGSARRRAALIDRGGVSLGDERAWPRGTTWPAGAHRAVLRVGRRRFAAGCGPHVTRAAGAAPYLGRPKFPASGRGLFQEAPGRPGGL